MTDTKEHIHEMDWSLAYFADVLKTGIFEGKESSYSLPFFLVEYGTEYMNRKIAKVKLSELVG